MLKIIKNIIQYIIQARSSVSENTYLSGFIYIKILTFQSSNFSLEVHLHHPATGSPYFPFLHHVFHKKMKRSTCNKSSLILFNFIYILADTRIFD